MGTAARKVRGGKLLRVALQHDGPVVTAITITGDFFLYPEEGLPVLERRLIGLRLDRTEDVAHRISEIMSEEGLTPLGFGPSDLAWAIMEAGQ